MIIVKVGEEMNRIVYYCILIFIFGMLAQTEITYIVYDAPKDSTIYNYLFLIFDIIVAIGFITIVKEIGVEK